MKCPYCDREMDLGYIQSRDGVTWTVKEQLVPVLAILRKGSVSLANGAADSARTVYAHKCSVCRKVIIDYSSRSGPAE